MEVHGEIADELRGDGMIIIDDHDAAGGRPSLRLRIL